MYTLDLLLNEVILCRITIDKIGWYEVFIYCLLYWNIFAKLKLQIGSKVAIQSENIHHIWLYLSLLKKVKFFTEPVAEEDETQENSESDNDGKYMTFNLSFLILGTN